MKPHQNATGSLSCTQKDRLFSKHFEMNINNQNNQNNNWLYVSYINHSPALALIRKLPSGFAFANHSHENGNIFWIVQWNTKDTYNEKNIRFSYLFYKNYSKINFDKVFEITITSCMHICTL